MEKSQERLDILKKIEEYEKNEWWDKDVENDPETKELLPDQVDYLNKKLKSKIATRIANRGGTKFYETMIKNNQFIIKETKGIENYLAVKGGAIITCNHFNICDNYAVYRVIKPYLKRKKLYKVIREGNYTGFTGPIGFFFRHCNTLPLSSNTETMKKFLNATKVLLKRGEKILIYPEQGMWWNYRKPRPCKNGAFKIAVNNNVPIIPCFITMEDSEFIDKDGFNVQAYTVNFLPPIYPKTDVDKKQNTEYLKEENYKAWKKCYEETYNIALEYCVGE